MYYLNTLVNSCIQNRRKMTRTVCLSKSFECFLIHGLALPLFANMIWKVLAFGHITALLLGYKIFS